MNAENRSGRRWPGREYPALFLAAIAGKGAADHRIALMERLATELPTDAAKGALSATQP